MKGAITTYDEAPSRESSIRHHAATGGAGPLLIANEGAGPSPDAARGRVAHGGGAGRGG